MEESAMKAEQEATMNRFQKVFETIWDKEFDRRKKIIMHDLNITEEQWVEGSKQCKDNHTRK